jgi:hypothetical protein
MKQEEVNPTRKKGTWYQKQNRQQTKQSFASRPSCPPAIRPPMHAPRETPSQRTERKNKKNTSFKRLCPVPSVRPPACQLACLNAKHRCKCDKDKTTNRGREEEEEEKKKGMDERER